MKEARGALSLTFVESNRRFSLSLVEIGTPYGHFLNLAVVFGFLLVGNDWMCQRLFDFLSVNPIAKKLDVSVFHRIRPYPKGLANFPLQHFDIATTELPFGGATMNPIFRSWISDKADGERTGSPILHDLLIMPIRCLVDSPHMSSGGVGVGNQGLDLRTIYFEPIEAPRHGTTFDVLSVTILNPQTFQFENFTVL